MGVKKDPRIIKIKNKKEGNWHRLRAACHGGLSGGQEIATKEGHGWLGHRWKEDQERRTERRGVPQLWRRSFLVGLQGMERNKGKTLFLLGKLSAQPPSRIQTGH